MRNNKYKFTYGEDLLDEAEVYNIILTYKIILRDCWYKTEDDAFRKIRPASKQKDPQLQTETPDCVEPLIMIIMLTIQHNVLN